MLEETILITIREYKCIQDQAQLCGTAMENEAKMAARLGNMKNELELRLALDEQNISGFKTEARDHLKRLNKAFCDADKYFPTLFEAREKKEIQNELKQMASVLE